MSKFYKILAVIAVGSMLLLATTVQMAMAWDRGISLADLAGGFAGGNSGFVTACTNSGGCSTSSPTLVPLNSVDAIQLTFDEKGNFCATDANVSAPVAGSNAPASAATIILNGRTTNFDPVTGQGDFSVKLYAGGSCHGPNFDSTGATQVATVTAHFVVSESGNRIDDVVTTFTSLADDLTANVTHHTIFRQLRNRD